MMKRDPFCRLSADLPGLELGPDLLREELANLIRVHEIRIDFLGHARILVHVPGGELDLQDLLAVIVSHRAQNPGLHRQSFHSRSPVSTLFPEGLMVFTRDVRNEPHIAGQFAGS